MDELEHKVLQSITRHRLISRNNGPVIVGLSGGADSVALLAALTALGYDCVAAHCNFGLRGDESIRDRDHARSVAGMLGCQWSTVDFDTKAYMTRHKISLEMACRELRYDWFASLMRTLKAQAVAVAHHRDDNIETLMLNLLRGSGIRGLRGMKPRNGDIIRPLLECTRSEITAYLSRRGIPYITDSSNLINDVARNRLRNIILPCIYREFPQAPDTIARTIGILADTEPLLDEAVDEAKRRYMTIDTTSRSATIALRDLIADHPSSAPTLLFELLHPYGFSSAQIRSMIEAADTSGATFHSTGSLAVTSRGRLELTTGHNTDDDSIFPIDLSVGCTSPIRLVTEFITPLEFTPKRDNSVLYLDAGALADSPVWELRRWRHGDRMTPFGMKGSRKLSDIFSDAGMSVTAKQRQWILTRNGEIVWIPGIRASALYPVTESTRSIMKISYIG